MFCSKRGHELFHNGVGKLFVFELLKLRFLADGFSKTQWFPLISTTGNPQTDWCGLYGGGLIDVKLESEELGLGEVKGDGEGLYQLLAAMQASRESSNLWPVGFVVNKNSLQLLGIQQRGKVVDVSVLSYMTTNLSHVLAFIETLTRDICAISESEGGTAGGRDVSDGGKYFSAQDTKITLLHILFFHYCAILRNIFFCVSTQCALQEVSKLTLDTNPRGKLYVVGSSRAQGHCIHYTHRFGACA